jgi:hypothetical protein
MLAVQSQDIVNCFECPSYLGGVPRHREQLKPSCSERILV